jgi:hypothetical protein
LTAENADLHGRLKEARDSAYSLLDKNDVLRRELKQRRNLLGSGYRYPMICSDGRVWAAPFEATREETIRWFAGQAIGGLLAGKCPDDSAAIGASVLIAQDLWDELEAAFKVERDKRMKASVDASQDETSQDET